MKIEIKTNDYNFHPFKVILLFETEKEVSDVIDDLNILTSDYANISKCLVDLSQLLPTQIPEKL